MLTVLERTYRRYNRKYFGNRLPKHTDMLLRWGNIAGMGYQMGDEIVINRKDRSRDSVWKLTLLHEMCHLALPNAKPTDGFHGRDFQKEMLRLAKAGALKGLW
jgi:predicted SprT family Zn-dependent metalloprotease